MRTSGEAVSLTHAGVGVDALSLFDNLPIRVAVKDNSGRFVYMNQQCLSAHGIRDLAEVIGKSDDDFFLTSEASSWRMEEEAIFAGGDAVIDKEECEHWKDGRRNWVLTSKSPLRDSSGKVTHVLCLVKDITPLLEELARYRLAVKGSRHGLWHHDLKTGVMWFSSQWADTLGLTIDELPKTMTDWQNIMHAEDRESVETQLRKHLRGETQIYQCEYRVVAPSGEVRWIRSRGTATRDEDGIPAEIAGSHEDITESKNLEVFYNRVLDFFPGLVWIKNKDLKFVYANEGLAEVFGCQKEQIIGKLDEDFESNPEEVARFQRDDRTVLASGQPLKIFEEGLTDSKGRTRILATRKLPLPSFPGLLGEGTNVLGVAIDVTDLRSSEAEIRRLAEMRDNIFNVLPQCVFVKDRDGTYILCNKSFAQRHGFEDPKEIIGKKDQDLSPREEAERYRKDDHEILMYNRQKRFRESQSLNGQSRTLDTVKIPLHDSEGLAAWVLGIYEDITDRLADERAVLHKDVAKSIGHALKNWLGVLTMAERTLGRRHPDLCSDPVFRRLTNATDYLSHSAQVATQIGALEAKHLKGELFSVVELVRSVAETLDDARLKVELPAQDVRCQGPVVHLRNAILELISNAMDFTPEDGSIVLSVEKHRDKCHIHCQDNGRGVSQSIKAEIFEFFTADDPKRTGMGLGYVAWVCERSSGTVRLVEEGSLDGLSGAHFLIELPAEESDYND